MCTGKLPVRIAVNKGRWPLTPKKRVGYRVGRWYNTIQLQYNTIRVYCENTLSYNNGVLSHTEPKSGSVKARQLIYRYSTKGDAIITSEKSWSPFANVAFHERRETRGGELFAWLIKRLLCRLEIYWRAFFFIHHKHMEITYFPFKKAYPSRSPGDIFIFFFFLLYVL